MGLKSLHLPSKKQLSGKSLKILKGLESQGCKTK